MRQDLKIIASLVSLRSKPLNSKAYQEILLLLLHAAQRASRLRGGMQLSNVS
jgi:hypothetical protein